MKHGKDSLECSLQKVDILVNLLGFKEPVSILIPDGLIENLDCFGKTIFLHASFNLYHTDI